MKGLIVLCVFILCLSVQAAEYPVINDSFFNIKLGQNISTLKNYLDSKDILYLKKDKVYDVVPGKSLAVSNTLFVINAFKTESGESVKLEILLYKDQVMDITVQIPFTADTLQQKVENIRPALFKKYGKPYSVKGTGIQNTGKIIFRKPYSALSVMENQNKYVNIVFAYSYNNGNTSDDYLMISYIYEDIITDFEQYLSFVKDTARTSPNAPAKSLIDEL